jgi:hypothetical protein
MLDRHPGLTVTPETHFLPLTAWPQRHHPPPRDHAALLRLLDDNPRIADAVRDRGAVERIFREGPPTFAGLFRAVLNAWRGDVPGLRVGEKTPQHLSFTPWLLAWFPGARVLCLERDGRAVVASLLGMPWATGRLVDHCRTWRTAVAAARRYSARWPERFRLVRYADLVLEPAATIRDVLGFLGVPPTTPRPGGGKVNGSIPAWELRWKHRALVPPDPDRLTAWRRELDAGDVARIESLLRPVLARCGYEPDGPPSPIPHGPATAVREIVSRLRIHARSARWERKLERYGRLLGSPPAPVGH